MADPGGSGAPTDPEAGWPPRFGEGFLRGAAGWVLGLFAMLVAVLVAVYLVADQFDGDDSARHVMAFALFVAGLLALLGGVWFALVEAKQPPPPPSTEVRSLGAAGVNPGALVTSVADAFGNRAVSRVLLTIGFVLVVVAAAGSGFVDISVSTGDAATPASPSATATP
jgi:hypothetical protein